MSKIPKQIVRVEQLEDWNDGSKKGTIKKYNLKDALIWEKEGAIKILDEIEEKEDEIEKNPYISKEDYKRLIAQGKKEEMDRLFEYAILKFKEEKIHKGQIKVLEEYATAYNPEIEEKEQGEEEGKKFIELPGNGVLISEFADKLAPVFKNKNLLFYREDLSSIVEIKNNEFKEVKSIRFITLMEKYFTPWIKRFKKIGGSFEVYHSISQITASAILASPNFEDGILKIERIFPVQIPIIYEGKLTFPKKGYDERFNSWTLPNSPEIKTDMPLEEAKQILYEIYNEFCFQSKQDYTNAIAGLLTPNLRGLFSNFNVRTPLKGYLANRERAGKDFCAGINGIVYEGKYVEETPISTGEFNSSGTNDELRKKLMSAFIQGRRCLHFANNKGKLNR